MVGVSFQGSDPSQRRHGLSRSKFDRLEHSHLLAGHSDSITEMGDANSDDASGTESYLEKLS